MGVRGLLSTCLERQDECSEMHDLVSVAMQRDGIELLVDYYSFQQDILCKFWKGLSRLKGNDYLRILGGEYASLDNFLTQLVQSLRALDINLVFYIDGSKGSSTATLRQKLDTWISRHEQDVEKMTQILDVLRGKKQISELPMDVNIRPVVVEDQFMGVLKKCECEINQSPAGEADIVLARALHDRPKAFAILSNDSDFCVVKNCKLIPFQLFDLENDLQLGEALLKPEQPVRLKVKVITVEKVMSMLKLNNHQLLIELSIVAGNDFTGPYVKGNLQQQLDVRGRRNIENYAGWIRHYKNIQNHPVLDGAMQRNPLFADAVFHSRNFYTLRAEPDRPPAKGYFSKVIEEGIRAGRYPCNIMGMHNNFYWHRMMLEENSYGQPCCECALTPLRAHVYHMVLPQHEQLVNEYGRSPYETLRKAGVMATDNLNVPPIHRLKDDKIFPNLRNFHAIMSHQEQGNSPNWFDRYGRKNGFIVYLLRYFLLLNWGRNLHVSDNEFLALVAMVFGRPEEARYQQIVLKPTVRCVTIGNWFQDIYRHAYSMLSSLLFLKHEFPLPSELFSGSAWTAIYMVCQDQTFYLAANQVPLPELYSVQKFMNKTISEKRHIIRHIVEGFFPFDDRW